MARSQKLDRIEARLPREQKQLLDEAAELAGLSVASFVVNAALQRAQVVVEQHTRTTLSLANARRLAEILDGDRPTPALLAAARRHKARRAKR